MRIAFTLGLLSLFALGACSEEAAIEPQASTPAETADAQATVAQAVADATPQAPSSEATIATTESAGDAATPTDDRLRLAALETVKKAKSSKFKKDVHYRQLFPTQPTVSGTDKIEVAEIFWYGCSHCYSFEPYVDKYRQTMGADVEFARIPAVWNPQVKTHGRIFFTANALAKSGKVTDLDSLHKATFRALHVNGNPLGNERSIGKFFEDQGVSADDFKKAWNSFDVDQRLRTAADLARRYGLTSVPLVVVNGKYAINNNKVNSFDEKLELIAHLVELER